MNTNFRKQSFDGTKLEKRAFCSDVLNSEECQTKGFSLLKCLLFSKPFLGRQNTTVFPLPKSPPPLPRILPKDHVQ